jgi:type II secretory pathway component PulF
MNAVHGSVESLAAELRALRDANGLRLQEVDSELQQQGLQLAATQQEAASLASALDKGLTKIREKQMSDHEGVQADIKQHVAVSFTNQMYQVVRSGMTLQSSESSH